MSTLTDFLLARIAEDETAARELIAAEAEHAKLPPPAPYVYAEDEDPADFETFAHVVRWTPARVLAECEAKRRIVEGIVPERDPYHDHPDYDAEWVLKDLASVYADHPDYRQEWKP